MAGEAQVIRLNQWRHQMKKFNGKIWQERWIQDSIWHSHLNTVLKIKYSFYSLNHCTIYWTHWSPETWSLPTWSKCSLGEKYSKKKLHLAVLCDYPRISLVLPKLSSTMWQHPAKGTLRRDQKCKRAQNSGLALLTKFCAFFFFFLIGPPRGHTFSELSDSYCPVWRLIFFLASPDQILFILLFFRPFSGSRMNQRCGLFMG